MTDQPHALPYSDEIAPTSDGLGTVVVSEMIGAGPYSPMYRFVKMFDGGLDDFVAFYGNDDSVDSLYGAPDHIIRIAGNRFHNSIDIMVYSDSGGLLEDVPVRPAGSFAADIVVPSPTGDVWVLGQKGENWPAAIQLDHYDANLSLVGSATAAESGDGLVAVGLSTTGNALAAWEAQGTSWAQWFGPNGETKSSDFALSPGSDVTAVSTMTLADGSVALLATRSDKSTDVFAVVPDASSSPQPAPKWLQDRAGARSVLVRGGRAYAFWPASSACSGLEIVALDGTSCGCLQVHDLSWGSTIGADGSLLVPYWHGNQPGTHWYPALLK